MILSTKQVEILLTDAIDRGEFSDLKGSGKPLEIDFKNSAMLCYMKRCGFLPKEVLLLKELENIPDNSENFQKRNQIEIEIDILRNARMSEV